MSIPYRKVKRKVIGPDHQVHEAWKMQQVNYTPINFEDFVAECVQSQGVSSSQVKGIADAISNRLRHYLKMGHSVQLAGIGTLKSVFSASTATSPDALNECCVRQIKVQFYPHKEFQNMIRSIKVVDLDAHGKEP